MKLEILTPDEFNQLLEDSECNYDSIQLPYKFLYSEYLKERNMNENYFKKLLPTKKKESITTEPNHEPFPSFYPNNTNIYHTNSNNLLTNTVDSHKCYLWADSTGHCGKCDNL